VETSEAININISNFLLFFNAPNISNTKVFESSPNHKINSLSKFKIELAP